MDYKSQETFYPELSAGHHEQNQRVLPLCPTLCLILLLSFLISFLCACSARKNVPAAQPQEVVEDSLSRAAKKISADLAVLNGSGQQLDASPPKRALSTPMTLHFEGPLPQALEKICAYTGFRLSLVGKAGRSQTMVHLAAERTPVLEILRDIGTQTGKQELLRVVEQLGLIELIRLDKEQGSGHSKADAGRK